MPDPRNSHGSDASSPPARQQRPSSLRKKLGLVLREARDRWKELGELEGARPTSLGLRPLTPHHDPDSHGPYVEELFKALKEDGVHNIALTGRYGAGKSSILQGLLERLDAEQRERRTVVLSLSTLDPDLPSEVAQAAGRRVEDAEGADLSLAMTKTNRVQKELVKQLLYREQPHRLPQSRFQRLQNRTWRSSALVGGMLMSVLTTLVFLFGVAPGITGTDRGVGSWQWWASYLLLFVIGSAGFGMVHWLVWERFIVRRVSAGGANIELEPRSTSYFDQYLDEIMYFFEATKTNLVIFEDLDRFEDHHIFQSLRDLNTLLNHSRQRQWRGGLRRVTELQPVRFIYATRDSIFETAQTSHTDASGQLALPLEAWEGAAARTKFFELVVPIVPFITPVSSRGLLMKELAGLGDVKISTGLQVLVAEHLTDMRLLRNITNEYRVFHHRLFGQGKKTPGLTEDALFALVVFKNLHPGEFEAVTYGKSKLNRLYEHAQNCIENDLRILRRERDLLRDGEDFAGATKMQARRAGEALAHHLGGRFPQALEKDSVTWQFTIEDELEEVDFHEPELWRKIARAQSSITIKPLDRGRNIGGSSGHSIVTIDQLRAVTGLTLEEGSWEAPDADELHREIRRLDQLIEEMQYVDFDKIANQGTRLDPDKAEDDQLCSLAKWMDEHLLNEPLIATLVRGGFIGRNFAAFLGESDISLPATVQTFILQHVNTNKPFFDYSFAGRLDSDDEKVGEDERVRRDELSMARRDAIRALLEETDSFLDKQAAYTRELMDYLLQEEQFERVDRIVVRLCSRTEAAELHFIRNYLSQSDHRASFASRLAPRWPSTFSMLHELFETIEPGAEADRVWTAALSAARADLDYVLTDGVAALLAEQHQVLGAFREPRAADQADAVVDMLSRMGLRLTSLAEVSDEGELRPKLVAARAYEINTNNLVIALDSSSTLEATNPEEGGGSDLSLDRVIQHKEVWAYCRECPEGYLAALPDEQPALGTPGALVAVLKAVGDQWDERVWRQVLGASHSNSMLHNLSDDLVDRIHWRNLAASNRFASTTDNLDTYIQAQEGEVDADLAHLLQEQGELVLSAKTDDETKERLGFAILRETEVLSAEERTRLVVSLKLGRPWTLAHVPAYGSLLGPMLKQGLLVESKDTFKHFLDASGWSAIEAAASHCENFATFLDRDFLGPAAKDLIQSADTQPAVRREVLGARFDEFFADNDAESLRAAATAAAQFHIAVPPTSAVRIAEVIGHSDPGTVLELLASLSPDSLPESQLRQALGCLPAPWMHFQDRTSAEFSAPEDEHSVSMLKSLEDRGMAKWDRRRKDRKVLVT